MNNETNSSRATRLNKWRRRKRGFGVALAALALLLMGSVIGGVAVVAATSAAKGIPTGIWKNQLKFGSNQLLVVFAVDSQGNIQPYFEKGVGRPEKYEEIQHPIATPKLDVEVGNPKVCWTTGSGDKECVTYR